MGKWQRGSAGNDQIINSTIYNLRQIVNKGIELFVEANYSMHDKMKYLGYIKIFHRLLWLLSRTYFSSNQHDQAQFSLQRMGMIWFRTLLLSNNTLQFLSKYHILAIRNVANFDQLCSYRSVKTFFRCRQWWRQSQQSLYILKIRHSIWRGLATTFDLKSVEARPLLGEGARSDRQHCCDKRHYLTSDFYRNR